MEIVADLHLHSKYSRAVSPQMTLENMAKWAEIKGIDLLGTGDWTHPLWLREIKELLEERSQGVFGIKFQISKFKVQSQNLKLKTKDDIRFLLTTEISSIYKHGGKCRKIHNLIIAPSVATVEKINAELKKRGCNISSDGRPIVGISAKNIAELVFSIDEKCLIIPAHIWTPWFSMFGEKSGFDSIEECFGEFSKDIYAVETGISSDPEMNWTVKDLDERSIVSFSDAHSGSKIGREVTVLEVKELNYKNIIKAFKPPKTPKELEDNEDKIKYTIEFYPEEGKYHYSGHRKCGVVFSPSDTLKKGTTCPVCGKRLTPGVMERVGGLGDVGDLRVIREINEFGVNWIRGTKNGKEKIPFIRLVPLKEIIAESLGVGESSKKVEEKYLELIDKFGSEIEILTKGDLRDLGVLGDERWAEGIEKVRKGDIFIDPGYDGEFGTVRIWPSSVRQSRTTAGKGKDGEQAGLF